MAQATLFYMGTRLPPPKKKTGQSPLIFGPCLLWPNGWMHQVTTWCGGRPQPVRHCVRRGPASPAPPKGHAPIFGPCLLWPNGRPSQLLLNSCLLKFMTTAERNVILNAHFNTRNTSLEVPPTTVMMFVTLFLST